MGVITFFLSSILNNLTVTIVMVSLMRKLLDSEDERKLFGAMIVIAANVSRLPPPPRSAPLPLPLRPFAPSRCCRVQACAAAARRCRAPLLAPQAQPNGVRPFPVRFVASRVPYLQAGGVWTPIGDVTTTMLWMNGQLSTTHTVTDLFAASIVSMAASMAVLQLGLEKPKELAAGEAPPPPKAPKPVAKPAPASAGLVLSVGVGALLSVPVFVEKTGLPPFMGMLTGACAAADHIGRDACSARP